MSIVIRGYLSTLSRPENIVYFFRTIKQVERISKETLRLRTDQYLSWVNAYTKNHQIPISRAEKDVRKKDDLAPLRTRTRLRIFSFCFSLMRPKAMLSITFEWQR